MNVDPLDDTPPETGWHWRKIIQYFLQGLLVTAPFVITIYVIYWFISSIDNLIPLFPDTDAAGNIINKNYGSGFILIIVSLILVGYLSNNFITGRIFALFDHFLERTPGIKFIYSSIKDFFEAFAGNKRKFNKAVLISIHGNDVWQIGFITDDDATKLGLKGYITVYVPLSYSFAGMTYIVHPDKVRLIDNISAGEALKYTVSGGIAEFEAEETKSKPHR